MLNKQIPEGVTDAIDLDVHSIFSTIQGEGPFAGAPAVFVRLAGCNLRCPACDTDYTSTRAKMEPAVVLSRVQNIIGRAKLIVVTGGEPLRQPYALLEFCNIAIRAGFQVQVETNGTLRVPDDFNPAVVFGCSPKSGKLGIQAGRVHAWKYVLAVGEIAADGLPLSVLGNGVVVARPTNGNTVFVQPEDEQFVPENKRNTDATVASAIEHGYRLCLQTHKIIGLP